VALSFLLALSPPALAREAAAPAAVAAALYHPTAIIWQPEIAYRSVTLRIVGPGGFVRDQDFGAGKPVLSAAGLADGQYTYELVFGKVPDPALAEALSAGVTRGERAGMDPGVRERIQALRATYSGAFRVAGGQITRPDLVEPARPASVPKAAGATPPIDAATKLTTLADDESIQGSLCVGLDCTSAESFGFDTIRLKENNTRITFQDTSTSAGFPNNVWTLTANDSASGGANKFSIDDVTNAKTPFTVLANAPTDSLFVSNSGRVGFRTATPVLDVHIKTSDTPAIRFEQDSGGGFTAQTWDIGANEANFFVRDVTGGSRLPLRIRPGAPTSMVDIGSTGVGIGTTSPNLGAVARALTVSTPNPAGGTSEFAALELQGGQSANTAFGAVRFYNRSNLNAQIAGARENADNTASLRFLTSNAGTISEKVRIMPSGFVGIGTSAPISRLHVQGDAMITGNLHVLGTCCGPDYVFDAAYRLASIDEEAAYIRDHHHLPAVGPARTTADGHTIIDVFQQSNGMLEELEKAHLYIQDLHHEIEALKAAAAARDAELRSELAALKAQLRR
jgi:hypothetical protein